MSEYENQSLGKLRLTRREMQLLDELIKEGAPVSDIAENLGMNTNTVRTHFHNIMSKTHFHTSVGLALWWQLVRLSHVDPVTAMVNRVAAAMIAEQGVANNSKSR